MIESYKNRNVDLDKPVDFYRCLNRKGFIFSVKQNGRVVGHTNNIVLKNCKFVINEAGKKRCLLTKVRNVHAFVKGTVGTIDDIKSSFSGVLKYNPLENKGFYSDSFGDLKESSVIYIQDRKIMCQL